jgi:hypothetical protein
MGTEYDIVTRLRDWATACHDRGRVDAPNDFSEAADEIERLRIALAEIAENRDEPYAADHARDALKGNR